MSNRIDIQGGIHEMQPDGPGLPDSHCPLIEPRLLVFLKVKRGGPRPRVASQTWVSRGGIYRSASTAIHIITNYNKTPRSLYIVGFERRATQAYSTYTYPTRNPGLAHLWADGERPEAAPVEEHVLPGQEDIMTGRGDQSHPPKFALNESEFPPGESGGDRGER